MAAAIGKVGAFVGTYIFPYVVDAAGDDVVKQGQYPFYVSSALCIFSALVALLLPNIGQDTITEEDIRFREYLERNGYDVASSLRSTRRSCLQRALSRNPQRSS